MTDLSILVPSRNEEWLSETVADILKNIRGNTEIIVVLDGEVFPKPLPEDPRVTVIRHFKARGQRAATNDAARVARGTYLLKADAHTAWDEGFDIKMLQTFKDLGDDITAVPVMKNLWVYDWKCPKDGKRIYQDKAPICPDCGGEMYKKVLWHPKDRPNSTSYCFDTTLHFQYFNAYKAHPDYQEQLKTGYTETMSLQGSAFMVHKDKYWGLKLSDEDFGSWGQQGVELACKTWLSGGRCIVNHSTWYAHLFRTKGDVFGFPYKQDNAQVEHARQLSRKLFLDNTWEHQKLPLYWLVSRFSPVPDWENSEMLVKIKEWADKFDEQHR
jgi:glycosyltransferase involved in cell wall biosynthesis